jgi:hypothetical protein
VDIQQLHDLIVVIVEQQRGLRKDPLDFIALTEVSVDQIRRLDDKIRLLVQHEIQQNLPEDLEQMTPDVKQLLHLAPDDVTPLTRLLKPIEYVLVVG